MRRFVVLCVVFGLAQAQGGRDKLRLELDAPCKMPQNTDGRCIYYDECPKIFALLNSPVLTTDQKKQIKSHQCGYKNRKPLVCCDTILPTPGICGNLPLDRIIGGEKCKLDEFSWLALVQYEQDNKKGFHCGGALITNRHVLTAAHCVKGPSFTRNKRVKAVRLGEFERRNQTDCVDGVCSDTPIDIAVVEIIAHQLYDPSENSQQKHDIAILRLEQPVRFTRWISPVCLPLAKELRSQLYVGENLTIAGFGETETHWSSSVKLKTDACVVENFHCASVYSEVARDISETQLCAGGESGKDSCRGDSGGPLMGIYNSVERLPYLYLAGIVSFGPTPCGQQGWPGVYTRINSYMDWITDNLK